MYHLIPDRWIHFCIIVKPSLNKMMQTFYIGDPFARSETSAALETSTSRGHEDFCFCTVSISAGYLNKESPVVWSLTTVAITHKLKGI